MNKRIPFLLIGLCVMVNLFFFCGDPDKFLMPTVEWIRFHTAAETPSKYNGRTISCLGEIESIQELPEIRLSQEYLKVFFKQYKLWEPEKSDLRKIPKYPDSYVIHFSNGATLKGKHMSAVLKITDQTEMLFVLKRDKAPYYHHLAISSLGEVESITVNPPYALVSGNKSNPESSWPQTYYHPSNITKEEVEEIIEKGVLVDLEFVRFSRPSSYFLRQEYFIIKFKGGLSLSGNCLELSLQHPGFEPITMGVLRKDDGRFWTGESVETHP